MDKKDVIAFFDRCAPTWDAEMICDEQIIATILDGAKMHAGQRVLDVACGTGIMIPHYLARGAAHVTAIDISPEMAKIAEAKFAGTDQVEVLCGDVEETVFDRPFDTIVIYNAFPHFPDLEHLIAYLSTLLVPGGTLTVAHGMSRAKIDAHHSGAAHKVSMGLMHEDELSAIFQKHLTVSVKLSDDRMYQVTGVKKSDTAAK